MHALQDPTVQAADAGTPTHSVNLYQPLGFARQFRVNSVNAALQSQRKSQAIQGFGRRIACSCAGRISGNQSGRPLPPAMR